MDQRTDQINRGLLTALAEAFGAGRRALIVFVEVDEEECPCALSALSSPMTAWTTKEIAEFLLEQAIDRVERLSDGSGSAGLPHLRDALGSMQAANAAIAGEAPRFAIGRA